MNGDKEKAKEIWEKVTNGKEINSKNYSCFNNIGTLKLLGSTKTEVAKGISIKFKLLESGSFVDFVHSVADETYSTDNHKQVEKLVDMLLSQLKGKCTSGTKIKLFHGCDPQTKKYTSKKITEPLIQDIETLIDDTKSKKKQDKHKAYDYGLKLFISSKEDLSSIKSVLGIDDLKYKMIADNLAKEILQCGIDYFQAWKESKDPSEEGVKLLKYADSVAVGPQTKDRIKEHIESMEEWASTAPIKDDLSFITKKLERFQNLTDTISNADDLVTSCKSKLQNVKSILGVHDDFYLQLSSAIVNNAQGMLVRVINEAQQDSLVQVGLFYGLQEKIRIALEVSEKIGTLDMVSELKSHYSKNRSILESLDSQLGVSSNTSRNTTNESEGILGWLTLVGIILLIILITTCS